MLGRLAPQEDESALLLYDQIQAKKQRMLKGHLISQSSLFPATEHDEVTLVKNNKRPFKIPDHWMWVRLGDIAQIVGGGTPDTNNPEYFADNGIPWLTPSDLYQLQNKFVGRGKRDISKLGLQKSSARLLPEGSVLFSSRAPIGYVAIAENDLCTNQGFKSCVPYIMEMNEFVYYFLMYASKEIEKNASGTTFKEVSGKIVQKIMFPLPPLAEQKHIVDKIDFLMGLLRDLGQRIEVLQMNKNMLVEALDDCLAVKETVEV